MERNTSVAFATKTLAVQNTIKTIADFGFSAAELAAAITATISVRTTGAMATWTGVNPSGTLGHLFAKDADPRDLVGNANLNALRFVVEDATVVIPPPSGSSSSSSAESESSASPSSTANVTITLSGPALP